ncbi:type II secretion system F family protein [Idiomarina sp. HP20-50]|uniref:type II secretion system F family protein n=1 Tax=Idiomarina sp. HP20-50 TaxID=3070813 RepID=UPI00294AC383|nr:type II secretion system F family protein [Idiomarina sp. HP20-50]MDV6316023.1 type II secretion system F family protein [Idiomarina sp. HP20-50]
MKLVSYRWLWQAHNQCGLIHADSALQARQLLSQHHIHCGKIERLSSRRQSRYKPALSLWYLLLQQTANLLASGLPLSAALRHSIGETPSKGLRWMVEDCIRSIERGMSFSHALRQYKNWLPEADIHAISWAEQNGQLADALTQLQRLARRQQQLKKQLVKALRYPLIVLAVATGVCLMMMGWVLPSFAALFGDGELPWLTATLLEGSSFLRDNGALIIGTVLVAFLLAFTVKNKAPLRWQRSLAYLPFIGQLLQDIKLQQLFHRLAVSLQTGTEARQALKTTESSLTWLPHKAALRQVRQRLESGYGWVDSFRTSALNEPRTLSFLLVAEQNGKIDNAFTALADFNQQRFEQNCERLIGLAEPLLMVVLGGIIGTLLVAMYLPLFSMGQQFQ